mgnify:CR=1 FL=1
MTVALEQADMGMLAKMLGEGNTSPQTVKQKFFEILGRQLGVSGQPKMIGDLAQAHGHPETGLPAKKKNSGGANRGNLLARVMIKVPAQLSAEESEL